ncbi:MAG: potassium channel protein [Myxococcota bacterium]
MIQGLALFVATCAIGVGGYVLAGWSLLDATYMVIITIFGVGYGEVRPVEPEGLRYFTIALIVAGYATAVYAVGGFVQFVAEGEINRALRERRQGLDIKKMRDHVIVCGFGRVGAILARRLADAQQEIVVIDESAERLERAKAAGFSVVHGDAAEEEVLSSAGIAQASRLATVLPTDSANVFVTLTATGLRPDLPVIARAEDPSSASKLERSGAVEVVLPAAIGADRIASLIVRPSAESLLRDSSQTGLDLGQDLEQLGLRMEELRVVTDSPLIDRPVREIEIGGNHGFLIVGLRRADGTVDVNPDEATLLVEGDTVVVVGHADDLPELRRRYETRRDVMYRGARVQSG